MRERIQPVSIAVRKLLRPLVPARFAVAAAQCVEEDKIVEPPGVGLAETVEAVAVFSLRVMKKSECGLVEQGQIVFAHAGEIDVALSIG